MLPGEPMLPIICWRRSFLVCTRAAVTKSRRTPKSAAIKQEIAFWDKLWWPPAKDRQKFGEEYDIMIKRLGKRSMDWCHLETRAQHDRHREESELQTENLSMALKYLRRFFMSLRRE